MKAILLFWYRLVLEGFQYIFFQQISPAIQVQKLIVWRDAHLGDGLLTIPALKRIRKNFPNSQIILISHNNGLSGIHFSDYLEEGIVNEIWDRSDWNLKELLKKIKDSRCNAFLALMPYSASLKWNLVSMFLVKFARVKFASGWKKESTFLGKRWIKKTIFPSEMERLEKLLDELKFEELKWSTNDLGIQKITYSPEIPSIPYLVISPFSKGIANYWPTSNWIRLGIEIHKKNPYELVIVGGESDREKANEILSKWGNGRFVSVPIPELVLWLEQAEVIIGADSGCIHLANLLKKKNIALFGNSDYRGKWAHPENPNQIILYSNKECQKCLGKRHLECTCMNHLPLDEVLIAMDSYF